MTPDKLDRKVKDSLQNMEVPFDPSGWDRLQQSLDSKVTKPTFHWKWKYSLNMIIALVASTALFATWYFVSASDTSVVENDEKPVVKNTDYQPAPVNTMQPVETNYSTEKVTAPDANTSQDVMSYGLQPVYTAPQQNLKTADGGQNTVADNNPPNHNLSGSVVQNPLMRGTYLSDDPFEYKVPKKAGANGMMLSPDELNMFTNPEYLSKQKTFYFGDQIDPRKGYIYNTKEADSMKRLMYYKMQEEENSKNQNADSKVAPPDSVSTGNPDSPPKKEKKKKAGKDKKETADPESVKDANSDSKPVTDTEKDPEAPGDGSDEEKKEDKKRNNKPKLDNKKKDPLDPYQN